jgi:hypothetical protein
VTLPERGIDADKGNDVSKMARLRDNTGGEEEGPPLMIKE